MKTKNLSKLTLLLVMLGWAASSQTAAFADDLQGAAEAVNRSQQNISQDNQALQQATLQMQQDRRAGLNTAADLQAIQSDRLALQNAQADYSQQLQQLRYYQGYSNSAVVNPGYVAPDGRIWERQPQGYYDRGAWQANPRYYDSANPAWRHDWNEARDRYDLNRYNRPVPQQSQWVR